MRSANSVATEEEKSFLFTGQPRQRIVVPTVFQRKRRKRKI